MIVKETDTLNTLNANILIIMLVNCLKIIYFRITKLQKM